MNDANNMRSYLDLLREKDTVIPHTGTLDSDTAEYAAVQKGNGEITKVMAYLKSHDSARYTKLGRNLHRLERISARVSAIKEEVKQDTRELVADLFHAEDECRTRMVETVSFIFQLTKNPKATETPQYKKILEELSNHMTPELITMMEELKKKYVTVSQKPPALTAIDKQPTEESITESGIGDFWKKLKSHFRKFLRMVQNWGKDYDARLDALKAQASMLEGADLSSRYDELEEASGGTGGHFVKGRGDADVHWTSLAKKLKDKITKKVSEDDDLPVEKATWKNPIKYKGYEIYFNPSDWTLKGDEIVYHVSGWEPGDYDGETGRPDITGYYTTSTIQDAKDDIDELVGDDVVEETDDWYSQDDLQDYNDAEADDYRNEGDDEDPFDDVVKYSAEEAVIEAGKQLGVSIYGEGSNERDNRSASELIRELGRYGDVYMLIPSKEDKAIEFHIADADNVNHHYGPMAVAWIEDGFYWES